MEDGAGSLDFAHETGNERYNRTGKRSPIDEKPRSAGMPEALGDWLARVLGRIHPDMMERNKNA